MIQQPELGKKITYNRKIKGLTQEELVDKCNLSVRTLQRIEAGKAIPRIHTIKLIFEALEIDFETSIQDSNLDNTFSIKHPLEQFYILFNLKTHSIKKILILSLLISTVLFGLFIITSKSNNLNKNDKTPPKTENKSIINTADLKLNEEDFSCINCFYENDDMIGYGVKFKKNGVNVDVQLIKLNIETGEFNTGFAKGIFLNNKVEVKTYRKWIDQKSIRYKADDSVIHDLDKNKITLKGNAKLLSGQNEFIEANKIIIFLE